MFTIFAFATTGGYSGETQLKVTCPDPAPKEQGVKAVFGYPFRYCQIQEHYFSAFHFAVYIKVRCEARFCFLKEQRGKNATLGKF